MKKIGLLLLAIPLYSQAMDSKPLPYHSESLIHTKTKGITNDIHRKTIVTFMRQCQWIPDAETINHIGNQITNKGLYNPQRMYDHLNTVIPQMIKARRYFTINGDSDATRSISFFILEMSRSFFALKVALDLPSISKTEEILRSTFSLSGGR